MNIISSQARGLFLLSSVEMWERFSYYSLNYLLALFLASTVMDDGFEWTDAEAVKLVGLYGSLAFLSPVIGGWLSDNYLGRHRAIILGGTLMALGHVSMSGPDVLPALIGGLSDAPVREVLLQSGAPQGRVFLSEEILAQLSAAATKLGSASGDEQRFYDTAVFAYRLSAVSFYSALGLVVFGNGLFKPSITATVGRLYTDDDPRRDAAYTLFWTAINAGAFFATFVAGYLGERYGWHYGFSAAAFGMALGLTLYLWKRRVWLEGVDLGIPERPSKGAPAETSPLSRKDKDRLVALAIMGVFAALFNTAFYQIFGLFNLFVYQETDRFIGTFEVPSLWILSLNPLFIMVFGPLAAGLMVRLRREGRDPSSPLKFAIAFVLISIAFLLMVLAGQSGNGSKVHILWPAATMLFLSCGEIFVQPIGSSLVNKLSPRRFVGTLFGIWFLIYAIASYGSGLVGALSEPFGTQTVFAAIACACLITGTALFFLRRVLVNLMHGAD